MKRLFLLRHAKAGYGTSDQNRPLAPRGQKDAFWLGQYLSSHNLVPDHVLCSSATRTQETLTSLQKGAETRFSAKIRDDLYLASAGHMERLLSSLDDTLHVPMIIAHNPGISLLFRVLAKKPPHDARTLKYPTCTLAILDFDVEHWADLKSHTGQLVELIIPHDRRNCEK